jgi:hypothetical protein
MEGICLRYNKIGSDVPAMPSYAVDSSMKLVKRADNLRDGIVTCWHIGQF